MTDDELVERLTLPKCPHGNNGHMIHDPTPHGNVTISTGECMCSVTVDWDYMTYDAIERRAIAAWSALCATVTSGEEPA